MTLRNQWILGSFAILWSGLAAKAQDLPPIGAPVAPAPAVAAAPAGPNLFTMLLPPPEMRERCRQKLCKCELIKLLRAGLAPASFATGGLVPVGNCCPLIRPQDLALPADSSQGAAARIMKDVEEAAARRAAVRYLGTVDCRYYPEAEEALINALRGDRIECVRYEAALALQRGCCCTKKVAKALTMTIEGSDKDGFPAERSIRVQDAAAMALSMCVFEDPVVETPIPEKAPVPPPAFSKVNPKDFYKKAEESTDQAVFGAARKALEKRGQVNATQILTQPHRASSQGLFGMFGKAVESTTETAAAPAVTREPAVASQSAPRRGLLYKLIPGPEETEGLPMTSPVAVNPPFRPAITNDIQPTTYKAPVPSASPVPSAAPKTAPPATPSVAPLPVRTSMNGTISMNEGFSTAAPTPMPAPRPIPQTPPSTAQTSRSEAGLLGFVILDEQRR